MVSIVDPRKYRKVAARALEQARPQPGIPEQQTSASEFFDAFRHLERLVRDSLQQPTMIISSQAAPRMSYSFRQMIDALLQHEKIDRQFYEELLEVNRYRNLVFHGHVDNADLTMVKKVREASARIEQLQNDT